MIPDFDDDYLLELVTDRFELNERLGSGAFGTVFRAYDRKHHSTVALKTLHNVEPRQLYHFKREFRSLADISHPNLVDLFELIVREEVWLFTMDYVDGVDFRRGVMGGPEPLTDSEVRALTNKSTEEIDEDPELLEDVERGPDDEMIVVPPLDEPHVRRTLAELVRGVMALHDYGKLHRDLKPENVLVTSDGRVVILDFGLAAEIDTSLGRADGGSESSPIVGTPRYLAPELVKDVPLRESTDWYSVGVMLFEVLTGRPPIKGRTTVQELLRKNSEPAPDITEFRTDVSAELTELCADLLAIEPEDRPGGPEILDRLGETDSRVSAASGSSRHWRASDTFVGRETQLRRLEELTEESFAEESARIVNVCGDSGVGKSALVHRFLDHWKDVNPETVVLPGRCYENESVPYKALDGVIDEIVPWVDEMPREELEELLGDDGRAVARLFPVLRRVDAIAESDRAMLEVPDGKLRQRGFDALRRIFQRLCSVHDVLVFIDDVQWGDEDSALLLEHLLAGPDPPSMLLVLTWREADIATSPFLEPLLELQEQLSETIPPEEIRLNDLTGPEARQLAHQIFERIQGADDADEPEIDVEKIVRESRGNPLFVDELSRRAMASETIDSDIVELDDLLFERVQDLPDLARRLLEVLAVAGQPVEREILRQAAQVDSDILPSISLLRSERLIRGRGTESQEIETYHDRVRSALVERLSDEATRRIHLQLATAYESVRGADRETLAAHFEQAGETRRAADYMIEAAGAAADALAFERACQLLERALELRSWPDRRRYELQRQLGDMYAALALGYQAAGAYLTAAEIVGDLDASDCRIQACEQLLRAGETDRATTLLFEELERLGFSPADSRPRMLLSILYHRWRLNRRGFDFDVQATDDLPRNEKLLIDALAMATTMFGVIDVVRGTYFHYHGILRALDAGYAEKLTILLSQQVAQDAARIENIDRAQRLLETAGELIEDYEHESENLPSYHSFIEGMLAYFQGKWSRAHAAVERSVERMGVHSAGFIWETELFRYFEVDCLHWLGRFDDFRDRVPDYLDEARERNDLFHVVAYRTKMAFLALCADDPDEAADQLEEAAEDWSREGYHVQHFWMLHARLATALYDKRPREAWDILSDEWRILHRSLLLQTHQLRIHIWTLRARIAVALLSDARGWRTIPAKFRVWRTLRHLHDAPVEWAAGFEQLIRGQVAIVDGERTSAVEHFRRAEDCFREEGMEFHTRAVQLHRGLVSGGESGRDAAESAREWMRGRGISEPESMACTITGFPPPMARLEDS